MLKICIRAACDGKQSNMFKECINTTYHFVQDSQVKITINEMILL